MHRTSTIVADPEASNIACVANLQVAVGSDQHAGKLEAYRIDRAGLHGCKAYFHYFMNNPNKALHDVSLHLFDRHGHLKPHLYGNFGPETDPGGLVFIRTLELKHIYHGGDIESQAIKQLLLQLNHPDRATWNLAGTCGPFASCTSIVVGVESNSHRTAS